MSWFGNWDKNDDLPDTSWTNNSKAKELIKKISQLKNASVATIQQNQELQELYKELDNIQDKCMHSWEVQLLFIKHRCYCRLCDKEDTTYVHND